MSDHSLTIVDLFQLTAEIKSNANFDLTPVNDHVIKLSVMTAPFYWHFHPNSDETFLVIEGSIFIDLEGKTIELFPNQLFTVPKNTKHRTRPKGSRSINITFERKETETVKL